MHLLYCTPLYYCCRACCHLRCSAASALWLPSNFVLCLASLSPSARQRSQRHRLVSRQRPTRVPLLLCAVTPAHYRFAGSALATHDDCTVATAQVNSCNVPISHWIARSTIRSILSTAGEILHQTFNKQLRSPSSVQTTDELLA